MHPSGHLGELDSRLDDALAVAVAAHGDDTVADRVWEQVVALLIERCFVSLRAAYLEGTLQRTRYVEELARLAADCRRVGLLGPTGPAT